MKKIVSALCALALGLGAFVATAAPASAYPHGGGYYRGGGNHYGHRHNDHGDAVAAGVIGLALGAVIGSAIANDRPARCNYNCGGYYASPPPPAYYQGGYGGYGGYDYYPDRTCFTRDQYWDPRAGGYVMVRRPYPC
ncbi:MAG: hypothetical protein AB7L65_05540 [Hyphomonadaceae bacterium]